MDNIIYGSHNTMTYLPIKNWWLFPGLLVARCQRKNYLKQFTDGARVFDLRPYFNTKSKKWEFAHGLIAFKTDEIISEVVRKLANLAKTTKKEIYIRVILERWDTEGQCSYFKDLCEYLEDKYAGKYVKFIGGNRKGDWKKMYIFKDDIPDSLNNQWVSSMAEDARWYEKAFPFLYAIRCNKRNKIKMREKLNLFDFI